MLCGWISFIHSVYAQGSRQKLAIAMKALETQNVYDPDPNIYKNALNIVRSSSLNCYSFEVRVGTSVCMGVRGNVTSAQRGGSPAHPWCPGYAQAGTGDTLETRASLLQRQLRIGDACTFRLIEKNVVALLPASKAYLKNQAAGALSDLIR